PSRQRRHEWFGDWCELRFENLPGLLDGALAYGRLTGRSADRLYPRRRPDGEFAGRDLGAGPRRRQGNRKARWPRRLATAPGEKYGLGTIGKPVAIGFS